MYNKTPWRIWSSSWPLATFSFNKIQIASKTILSPQANMGVITLRNGKELPPYQIPLQPLVITTNKLQAEQKERLLQDLKKLGDFYKHLVKHSTLRPYLEILTSKFAVFFYDDCHGRLSGFGPEEFAAQGPTNQNPKIGPIYTKKPNRVGVKAIASLDVLTRKAMD
ncbi:hypothetical protein CR513_28603, partial [Mucuna pruriens]